MTHRTTSEILNELLTDTLAEERNRKDSLAQRSITVITTSGTLVTIILGVNALVVRPTGFRSTWVTASLLIAAVITLLVAATLALLNNAPRSQTTVDVESLAEQAATVTDWSAADENLDVRSYQLRVRLATDLRLRNRRSSLRLMIALVLEFLALALLAVCMAGMVLLN